LYDRCCGADFSFPFSRFFLQQATQLTAIRTAAGSAVATNALAKKNAHVMVVFGTPSAISATTTRTLHSESLTVVWRQVWESKRRLILRLSAPCEVLRRYVLCVPCVRTRLYERGLADLNHTRTHHTHTHTHTHTQVYLINRTKSKALDLQQRYQAAVGHGYTEITWHVVDKDSEGTHTSPISVQSLVFRATSVFSPSCVVVVSSLCADENKAVSRADIIVTATNSSKPIFNGKYLKPGAHINAIGTRTPRRKEKYLLSRLILCGALRRVVFSFDAGAGRNDCTERQGTRSRGLVTHDRRCLVNGWIEC
jgi:hypothetical protein